jgi:hypothetical protein
LPVLLVSGKSALVEQNPCSMRERERGLLCEGQMGDWCA